MAQPRQSAPGLINQAAEGAHPGFGTGPLPSQGCRRALGQGWRGRFFCVVLVLDQIIKTRDPDKFAVPRRLCSRVGGLGFSLSQLLTDTKTVNANLYYFIWVRSGLRVLLQPPWRTCSFFFFHATNNSEYIKCILS